MLKRLMIEERGFTLVELLVTISILAVLFGIVTLSLGGVGANAESTVNDAELGVVQSAVDIYLADNNVATLTAGTTEYIDGDEDFAAYVRLPGSQSKCQYSWTTDGDVTQDSCP